jgi:hypothetical protein
VPDSVTPRPGSAIWRRTDINRWCTYLECSAAGAEDCDDDMTLGLPNLGSGEFIYDMGNEATEFEIERLLDYGTDTTGMVIIAPSRPPFGRWEKLDTWPI